MKIIIKCEHSKGRISHLLSETATVLLRDSLGHRHGGYTTRLRAADLSPGGVTRLRQVLSDLCGLTGPRLSNNNQDLVVMDGLWWINRKRKC